MWRRRWTWRDYQEASVLALVAAIALVFLWAFLKAE